MSDDHREKLMALMATHGIGVAHYENAGSGLRVSVGGTEKSTRPSAAAKDMITAPHAGLFRPRHPLALATDVANGPLRVQAGAFVAYLQIGALLRPVVAPRDGVIGPALVADGALTGYRSPLFAYL